MMRTSLAATGSGGSDASPRDQRAPPDAGGIRQQLHRILGSDEFLGTERTRRFLRYVVEETLAGRGERIKAFSVAVAAFDRDETFNPQTDPIVRIEAGRLRRCLERYYLVAGAGDEIRIAIPKGSYVPDFAWTGHPGSENIAPADAGVSVRSGVSDEAPDPSSLGHPARRSPLRLSALLSSIPWVRLAVLVAALLAGFLLSMLEEAVTAKSPAVPRALPSIAVLPFDGGETLRDGAVFSVGISNEIVRELHRHPGLVVLGPRSVKRLGSSLDVVTIGREAHTAMVLSGDVHGVAGTIRVAVQLSETESGSVIWAETFDRTFEHEDAFELQAEIARDIARYLASPQGPVVRFERERP